MLTYDKRKSLCIIIQKKLPCHKTLKHLHSIIGFQEAKIRNPTILIYSCLCLSVGLMMSLLLPRTHNLMTFLMSFIWRATWLSKFPYSA